VGGESDPEDPAPSAAHRGQPDADPFGNHDRSIAAKRRESGF
jgi:hypothetical protein